MKTATDLIHYRCTAPGHEHRQGPGTADTLTVHQGKWSFCAHSVQAEGHIWTATGGVRVQNLRGPLATIRLDLGAGSVPRPRELEPVPEASAPRRSRATKR